MLWYRASDIAKSKNRKTVKPEDIYQALNELDLGKLEEPLRSFMEHYNADKEDRANLSKLKIKNLQ